MFLKKMLLGLAAAAVLNSECGADAAKKRRHRRRSKKQKHTSSTADTADSETLEFDHEEMKTHMKQNVVDKTNGGNYHEAKVGELQAAQAVINNHLFLIHHYTGKVKHGKPQVRKTKVTRNGHHVYDDGYPGLYATSVQDAYRFQARPCGWIVSRPIYATGVLLWIVILLFLVTRMDTCHVDSKNKCFRVWMIVLTSIVVALAIALWLTFKAYGGHVDSNLVQNWKINLMIRIPMVGIGCLMAYFLGACSMEGDRDEAVVGLEQFKAYYGQLDAEAQAKVDLGYDMNDTSEVEKLV